MGQTYDATNQGAFTKFLAQHGKNFATWARNHPNAAKAFDPVAQQLYSGYHPQISALQQMKKDMDASYAAKYQNLATVVAGLLGDLGKIPGMVSEPYTQGANAMSAAGTGYGNLLNTDAGATAATDNAKLAQLGSGQTVQGGTDSGNALAGMAGWLPASMMNTQGAAFTKEAQGLPQVAQQQALALAKQFMDQQTQDTSDWQNQMQSLVSGIPGDYSKAQASYQSASLAQQKQDLAQATADEDYWYKQAQIQLAGGRIDLAKQSGARARAAAQRAGDTQKRLDLGTQGSHMNGNPKPGYAWNKTHTAIIKDPKANPSMNPTVMGPKVRAKMATFVKGAQFFVTPTSGRL